MIAFSQEIDALEAELSAVCEKNGWDLERTGSSDSTNSRYYAVRKPTDILDDLECTMDIVADVRLSDHANQSRTSYHANRLFNVAPGEFTLDEFEAIMKRAAVIDREEAVEDNEISDENIKW